MSASVPYQVAWRWRHEGDWQVKHDDVQATNATQAMRKVRALLGAEYALERGEVVFLEVYRI